MCIHYSLPLLPLSMYPFSMVPLCTFFILTLSCLFPGSFATLPTGYLYYDNTSTNFSTTTSIETRPLKTYVIESAILASSGSAVLFSDTTGPGNVASIQVAMAVGVSNSATQFDSLIVIRTDGVLRMSAAVGLFFLTYDLSNYVTPFVTDRISISAYSPPGANAIYGVYRELFIPYTFNCSITLVNSGTAAPTIWTTVEYRNGGFPSPAIYGSRRIVFNANAVSLTGTAATVGLGTPINVLPQVTGKVGQLDSIQLVGWGTTSLQWVEGNPTIVADGVTTYWPGTEDFFGIQFALNGYLTNGRARATNRFGCPVIAYTASPYQMSAYRFFDNTVPFSSSINVTLYNGQAGQSDGSSNTFAYLAIYYTTT